MFMHETDNTLKVMIK